MGRRGPAAVPDNVRELRGNPGKRPAPRRLKLPPKAPKAPTWLPREAKAEWNRVVPGLDRMGVLAEVDRGVLTAYCLAWHQMVEAAKKLEADGIVRPGRDKADAKHPAWQVFRESATQLREFAKELYLTPTARLRSELPQGDAGAESSSSSPEVDILD